MGAPDNARLRFIERTMCNLEFIEDRKDRDSGPFEFTQLLNSFLMAFIHPKEYWLNEIDNTEKLPAAGWPPVNTEQTYLNNEPKTLRQLVVYIRNAMAHGNFDIFPNTQDVPQNERDIWLIRLWNTPTGNSNTRIWETTITVEQMRQILLAFIPQVKRLAAVER